MKNKKLLVILGIVALTLLGGISVIVSSFNNKQKIKVEVTETSEVDKVTPKQEEDVDKAEESEEEGNEESDIQKEVFESDDGIIKDENEDGEPDTLPYQNYDTAVSDGDDDSRTGGLSKQDTDRVDNITDEQRQMSEEIFSTDQGGVDDTKGVE